MSEPMSEGRLEKFAASSISRRSMLKRIGAGAAIAWSAPVLSSLRTPAFASYPPPHPECEGATCSTFIACSSSNPDCVCVTNCFPSGGSGGTCTPGSTLCADLVTCGADCSCPAGSTCAKDTCCGVPVCIPDELTGTCPAASGATGTRTSSGAGTVGG